ncbi:MAG: hypothetical protein K5986_04805, partial [Clostridium sp.]|nr:hypothetical protein [Clostridium sp.]
MKKKGVSRNFLVSIILSVLSSALLYCIAILNLGLDILKNDLSNTQKTVITGILIVLLIWSFTYT